MKVTSLYGVHQFNQSSWLAIYIFYFTEQMTKAKNELQKLSCKLMNDAFFEKQ